MVIILSEKQGFSQSEYADSIRNVIAGQPDNREKADNLVKMAKEFLYSDYDSMMAYTDAAWILAEKLNYQAVIADVYILKGRLKANANEMQEALDYFEQAFHIADSLHEVRRMAVASYNAGIMLKELSENNKAIDMFGISYDLFRSLNDTVGIMAYYNEIGSIYKSKSEYDSAAIYFHKAIALCELTDKEFNLAIISNNLASVYLELGQLENARKLVIRSLEIKEKSQNLKSMALDYILLGRIDSESDDFNNALSNYQQAEKLFLELNDSLQWCDVQNNIGVLYLHQDNYSVAGQYFEIALSGYRKLNFVRGIIVVSGNQGVLLSDQGKYMEAIAIQDTVLRLATEYGLKEYRKDALQNISDNYRLAGDFKKAYEFQSRLYELNDSIFTLEKEALINDLLFRYEKEKDQALILALEKENLEKDLNLKKKTIQRNAFLYTVVTVFIFTVFLFLYINQRRKKDRIIAEQRIHQLEEEKKLMAAKLLVEGQEEERKRIAHELHDGLGVLLSATKMQFTTLKDISPANQPLIARAAQLLEQASGDVRKISHNMMPGLLTKLGLYEAVEDLFENLNDKEKMNAVCLIAEGLKRLPENQEIMIYRIIQEMVNNTIKHAGAANISLEIRPVQDKLELVYSDDGKGFDAAGMLESKTLGLKSIQSRVSFLNGTLDIDSRPGQGAKFTIQIPA